MHLVTVFTCARADLQYTPTSAWRGRRATEETNMNQIRAMMISLATTGVFWALFAADAFACCSGQH
jgi:hypothetical protein